MRKFKGFTLTELMVAVAVLGVISAIVLPMLLRNNPNQSKMMMKKAYYTTSSIISEMINDSKMYPLKYDSSGKEYDGFDNVDDITIKSKTYGGGSKFGKLFASFLNVDGDIWQSTSISGAPAPCATETVGANRSLTQFKTQDGMLWCVDFSADGPNYYTPRIYIYVDTNGDKAPNCYQGPKGGCTSRNKNFDRFVLQVAPNGKIKMWDNQSWASDAVTVGSDINSD